MDYEDTLISFSNDALIDMKVWVTNRLKIQFNLHLTKLLNQFTPFERYIDKELPIKQFSSVKIPSINEVGTQIKRTLAEQENSVTTKAYAFRLIE